MCSSPEGLAEAIKAQALALGFDMVGICRPAPTPRDAEAYLRWTDAGMQGAMGYMSRPDRMAKTMDPRINQPTVRSIVAVGKSFFTGDLPPETLNDASRGIFASYAWGLDYHDLLTPRLKALRSWIEGELERAVEARVYVDTGPVLERDAAVRAGLGFVGRNTMLIHPRWGAWLFLGEILLDLELPEDELDTRGTCGRCTRCLDVCPTDAFPEPYVLDARRCISYLTIELKGPIPTELRQGIGNRIFGCDICNEVCPWNKRFARVTDEPGLQPDPRRVAPPLLELIGLDDAGFRDRFKGTPVERSRRRGLLRNVCVGLGNWGSDEAAQPLEVALSDHEPLIRGHAAWALGQIGGRPARQALEKLRSSEPEQWVRAEIEAALEARP